MSEHGQGKREAHILILDDILANRIVLTEMLEAQDLHVRAFAEGSAALAAADSEPPDLVLLDIMMPGMNGYEVCERLKQNPKLQDIPVIFISGLQEEMDKVRAFQAGGVDYVLKPFQIEEVRARVHTHLRLRWLQQDLADRNRDLQQSLARLQETERLRDNLVHMIVHDMRSPLMSMGSMLELLQLDVAENLSSDNQEALQTAIDASTRLTNMVSAVLDVSRLESGKMPLRLQACDLRPVVEEALHSLAGLARQRRVDWDPPSRPVSACCDSEITVRIVANLLGNALKFTPADGTIRIVASASRGEARLTVSDTGPGIPAEYHQKIFEKFGQLETRRPGTKFSTGLGLAFCRLAAEAQGGRIGVDSEVDKGSTFWLVLPASDAAVLRAGECRARR